MAQRKRFRCARAASKPNARAGSVRAAAVSTQASAGCGRRHDRRRGDPREIRGRRWPVDRRDTREKRLIVLGSPNVSAANAARATRGSADHRRASSRRARRRARRLRRRTRPVSEHERDVRHVPVLVPVLRGQNCPEPCGVRSLRRVRRRSGGVRADASVDASVDAPSPSSAATPRGDVETQSVRFSVL